MNLRRDCRYPLAEYGGIIADLIWFHRNFFLGGVNRYIFYASGCTIGEIIRVMYGAEYALWVANFQLIRYPVMKKKAFPILLNDRLLIPI
jgi:hypothetical protein